MAREKSQLTEPMVYVLGKVLNALTSTVITEDIVRTTCRRVGIAAVGQGELSSWLRKLRPEMGSPQDQLETLAKIIPDGLLTALLLVAQEYAVAHANHVYHADMEANMSIQTQLLSLQNAKAEVDSAFSAKGAECEELAKQLALLQETISSLNERLLVSEKRNSYLQGMINGNKIKKGRVAAKDGSSRAKVAAPTDKKNRPQKTTSEAALEGNDTKTALPSPSSINGVWGESTETEDAGAFT